MHTLALGLAAEFAYAALIVNITLFDLFWADLNILLNIFQMRTLNIQLQNDQLLLVSSECSTPASEN